MLDSLARRIGGHPRHALAVALVFVIVAGVIGGPLAGSLKTSGGFAPPKSDSQVATQILERASGAQPTPGVVLVVRTPQGAGAATSGARVGAARRRLAAVPGVLSTTAPAAVSRDRHQVLVTGTLRAGAANDAVAVSVLHAFHDDPDVVVGGTTVANHEINSTVTKDLGFAELLAFPLLVVLSIVFFRGRAALMPLAVGVVTVLGAFLVLTGVNQVYSLSIYALNLVIGLGLGLAIDYTLFMVTRFREELATGADPEQAIRVTMRRAGSTVLFSAATVACALATLTLFPQGFLKSMGIAGATVAIVAALAAVTISPALLGLWGVKLARRTAPAGPGRWYRFAHAVMRHPGLVASVTAAVMLAAAVPALSVAWSPANDSSVIPSGQSARVVADALTRDFDGAGKSPVTVAIRAPRADADQVEAFARRVSALPGVTGAARPQYLGTSTWKLNASVAGDPAGSTAQRVVNRIRALPMPFETWVSGDAATFVDQQNAIGSHLPEAIALLAALTFLVLWLMTDSIVLPLKAIVMNALTVGASLASLVVIYQHGRLTGLLHYTPDGGVEPTDFVVAATVVFALSTDYGVFMMGRIKEAHDVHPEGDEREAVAAGLGVTGRVVTAAAILLAVAIGAFSTSDISFIQEIGVAVAVGVLVDAFIVRSLLVPSLMALLGRWNWWSPRTVHRLHERVAPDEAPIRPRPA
jgi:uncharacterized membrane protein YdfJ with MMPL/SSD domain